MDAPLFSVEGNCTCGIMKKSERYSRCQSNRKHVDASSLFPAYFPRCVLKGRGQRVVGVRLLLVPCPKSGGGRDVSGMTPAQPTCICHHAPPSRDLFARYAGCYFARIWKVPGCDGQLLWSSFNAATLPTFICRNTITLLSAGGHVLGLPNLEVGPTLNLARFTSPATRPGREQGLHLVSLGAVRAAHPPDFRINTFQAGPYQ